VTRTTFMSIALLATGSAAAGWFSGTHWQAARLEEQRSSQSRIASTGTDTVTVFGDGSVSVQIRRAPLNWLLGEISRQRGKASGTPWAQSSAPSVMTALEANTCNEGELAPVDTRASEQVLQALREGNEIERKAALQKAFTSGVEVPSDMLQQLVDTDPSSEVRLNAYKAYLDSASNDATVFSAVLAMGHNNANSDVRAEARKRQDEFDALQRAQALAIQQPQ
jgi:hypothetical protein